MKQRPDTGIPKDSVALLEYHKTDCGGQPNCECFSPISLGKEYLHTNLLDLSEIEAKQQQNWPLFHKKF